MSAIASTLPLVSPNSIPRTRLSGLDALRGVAAVMVMLFHYTTRYGDKFGHTHAPAFGVPWGHLGVNLFFMISGFVIFMTLERTQRPMDFLVSRFSRLYPAYWVALLVTFTTLALVPSLGKEVGLGQLVANGLMFHGLLGIEHIDGVYWTLEVELLFYWAMFFLWLLGAFASPVKWIAAWLALSLLAGALHLAGKEFPYVISRVLILPYFPYFALGILLNWYFKRREFRWQTEGLLGALALLAIALMQSLAMVVWATAFLLTFVLVVFQFGESPVVVALARLGSISYPLYLLHENIGWTVIQHLEARGLDTNTVIAFTGLLAIAMATALHVLVEKPAMNAIRAWRDARRATVPQTDWRARRWMWIAGTLAVGLLVLVGNRLAQHA